MKWSHCCCVTLCLLTLTAHSQIWSNGLRLNDAAVTNAQGQIIVLGTEGSWSNAGAVKERAFDNNTATFFDPPTANEANAWAGFELQSPRVVTRIRYIGRSGFPARMRGVLFQGANQADFSDAVTLHIANPPAGWPGNAWVDVTLSDPLVFTPFKYLRFHALVAGACGGNAAEVEFYGVKPLTPASVVPSDPVVVFADSVNWAGNFRFATGAHTMVMELQRKLFDEAQYTTVMLAWLSNPGESVNWRDPMSIVKTAAYRIRARNNIGNTAWQELAIEAQNAAQGLWIGTGGAEGAAGNGAFDGNIATFFDAIDSNGGWSGLQLESAKMVAGVRYVPREGYRDRMLGGAFEGANSADFSDATNLHTITTAPSEWSIAEAEFTQAQGPYRYLRYRSPDAGFCNVAEVEFVLAPEAPKVPLNLRIVSSDLVDDHAVLTWDYDTGSLVSSGNVYRAIAPGGPYASLTPEGVWERGWRDTTAVVGVIYYYRVALQYTDGTAVHEGEMCAYRTHRRAERLDRDWSNLTRVKEGVSILGMGQTYQGNPTWDVDKLFDGSLDTYYDSAIQNPKPGLDFGAPHGLKLFRYAPRSANVARVNGSRLFGDSSDALDSGVEMGTLQSVAGQISNMPITTDAAYRWWYVTRVDDAQFYGNLTEMEFYGWPAANLTYLLIAPLSVEVSLGQPISVGLAWELCANAAAYQVERSLHGIGDWSILDTVSAPAYMDSTVTAGVAYDYRIASLRGAELAYSDTVTPVPYVLGAGTGLNGYYSLNYKQDYDYAETQALVRVDAQIDFPWTTIETVIPSEPNSADNIGITWYGQLEIPHDGEYTFHISSDDGCALRIDGEYLINYWGYIAAEHTGSSALSAGLHTIQIDYYNLGGPKHISLAWSGAVMREIIPATQLFPQELPSADIGVWRGRTFSAPRLGGHLYNADTDAIEVYSYGKDLTGALEGMHYLYQKVEGSFIFEADVDGELDPLCTSAKSMIMVRAALPIGSPMVAPAFMFNGKVGCKARLAAGANIVDAVTPAWIEGATRPTRLRIKRVGRNFQSWYKTTGGNWKTLYSFEDLAGAFGDEAYVGMAVCAPPTETKKMLQKGTFKNINLWLGSGSLILIR
ncbi:MAG: PA14 domain-containing protein [Kiritimatiellae bacterium]|nr:PA14 domain-containing protein [Kiritimatiellia bacterium]